MDFVLVHGTTQSPAGWDRLVKALEVRGHCCIAVDLSAVDTESASATYVAHVAQTVNVRAPVVVAHSGAGMLLAVLAMALNATRQIFLAAAIPDATRSLMTEVTDDALAMFDPEWIGKDPTVDTDVARRFLFHDCNEATVEWALTTLRAFHPDALYHEVMQLAPDIPATVIVPDEDRTLRAGWMIQAARHRLGVEPIVIPGGHCPHVSRPELIADLLLAA